MNLITEFFKNNGYVFEILLSVSLFVWGRQCRKRFVPRVFGVIIGMLFVSILWQYIPVDNAWIESLRTAVFYVL